ncbi:ATP-binding protein [Microvirga massiliensis]|uniref:ATP-binding protein n=1 Tax=Microvirga massiliensis TaxID=1033741 RepID=UPI00062B879C|nr:ATP-binding protein [Microvirga massiliensis]
MKATGSDDVVREDAVSRMRRLQSERRARGGDVMAGLMSAYFGTPRDKVLEAELDTLIDSFLLAEDAAGDRSRRVGRLREGRALTVMGESGVGKSRALDRHFLKREEFAGYGDRNADCILVSVTTPSPCTLRLLGMTVLAALGYEITRELKENVVWDIAHHQLALRGIRFLHIDELQHVLQSRNAVEIKKVQDTLKGLMQHTEWPVWLILSGLPSIGSMLCGDEQVWRRARHVVFEDLTLERDAALVRRVIAFYGSEKAGLSVESVTNDGFVARLLHAAINRFGIVIEVIQDAIRHALLLGSDALGTEHFAAAYAGRTGCLPEWNVFTAAATDWHLIDPRAALQRKDPAGGDGSEDTKPTRTRNPRDRRNK